MIQKSLNNQRIAIFPGSFDPFTIGHYSIVERALDLFDKVIVAIGYNEHKVSDGSVETRLDEIRKIYCDNQRVEVTAYTGLTVDFAKKYNTRFIVRGVRSFTDFEYERNLADVNRRIANIETILLFSQPEHAYISSSMVRELKNNNYDITDFIP